MAATGAGVVGEIAIQEVGQEIAAYCLFVMLLVTGCASTTFTVTPSPQAQVRQSGSEKLNAVVLWGGSWRANQKDVQDRESAAARGIDRFFGEASCFSKVTIRKEQPASALSQTAASLRAALRPDPK